MSDRETLDVDVLIVGGGPAGLSAALASRAAAEGAVRRAADDRGLEKAREAGAHMLSGAVLDPPALAELLPDYRTSGAPIKYRRPRGSCLPARRRRQMPGDFLERRAVGQV